MRSHLGNNKYTEENISKVHSLIKPADVRAGEPIKAFIKKNEKSSEAKIWRISPLGVEIIKSDSLSHISKNDLIELEIFVGLERTGHLGLIVTDEYNENHIRLIAIRFYQDGVENWQGRDRRATKRWSCSSDFMPNGVCPNPGKFNDFIFFKVIDLSSNGLRFQTSLRNKFLIPGMSLKATVTLPTVGSCLLNLKVQNADIIDKSGKEHLSVGCSFQNISKTTLEMIGQYVYQFGPQTSLSDIKESGLQLSQLSKGIEFKYVRTKEEFEQVIELRKIAYGEAGKITSEDNLTDLYDARSRIIIGLFRGKVVASTRLIFNEIDDQMEHEQFITLDSRVPRKNDICEITRVCTHPEFRGADLLAGLLKYVALTVAQSGRRYILGSATSKLLGMYLKMGFKNLNIKYSHEALNSEEHFIFLCDITEVAVGKGCSPIVWNLLWSDVVKYISENHILSFNSDDNVRIGFYRLFKPIANLTMKYLKTKKVKRSKSTSLEQNTEGKQKTL